MNASLRRAGSRRPRRMQGRRHNGATTVEFALTVGLSLALMFAIIEFAIGMYNQGVLVHATRVGAREASLFWVDPNQLDPDDPLSDQRIHRPTIQDSIEDWTGFVVTYFSADDPEILFQGQPIESTPETPVVQHGVPVRVNTDFRYRGPITSALSTVIDLNLNSEAVMSVE